MEWLSKITKKLRRQYQIQWLVLPSYRILWSVSARLWVFVLGISFWIVGLLLLGYWLTRVTALRYTIPGYPTKEELRAKQLLVTKLSQMEEVLAQQDSFIRSFRRLTLGVEVVPQRSSGVRRYTAMTVKDERFRLKSYEVYLPDTFPVRMRLFLPIDGVLTRRYEPMQRHYGIDLSASKGALVHSIAEGVVIFAEYSFQTGKTLAIQHFNGLVSFYKHNERLLKQVGDFVKAGEPIAVVGSTGEYTTGPHLHLELWYKGKPIDPLLLFPILD